MNVVLAGSLVDHVRGEILTTSLGASAGTSPHSGALLVFGREFQKQEEAAVGWLSWAAEPGRLLLLLPPFARGETHHPVAWQAPRADPLAGGEHPLTRLLAGERRHEIQGQLLSLERIGGHVVTAGWRRHPASGLVAITALPLWSLTVLDHPEVCRNWLTALFKQAGQPRPPEEAPPPAEDRELTQDEWTMLLHLCTGPFADGTAALQALAASTIHHLQADIASEALAGLSKLALVDGGVLTPQGKQRLRSGPYAPYALHLWRQHGR